MSGPRWTLVAGLAGATVAALVPVLGLMAARTLGDSTTGTLDVAPETVADVPETPGALLVAVDGGEVVGLTTFALLPSGSGGTVMVVPTGSAAPADGVDRPTRLATAYPQGGLEAQRTAVEGLLGVTFSVVEEVDEAGMVALLAPLAPIPVDLPQPVVRTAADGTVVMLLVPGPQELSAEQAASALFTRAPNQSEIIRLPTNIAIWDGVVAVADRVAQPAPDGAPPDVAGFLAAIGAGPRTVVSPVATPALDAVTNPDGIDLLELDLVDLRVLVARILPTAASPTGSGLRVQLVNESGDPDALYEATARLQFVGASVVAVDDGTGAAPTQGTTLVHDPSLARDQVDTLTLAVGPAAARPASEGIDGVDVTVILGREFTDFLREAAAEARAAEVTTTTGVSTSASGG